MKMKSNLTLVVFLVTTITCCICKAVEPITPVKLSGVYHGELSIGAEKIPILTKFSQNSKGELLGSYTSMEAGEIDRGTLSDFKWHSRYILTCKREDKYGKGVFNLLFSAGYEEFSGYWGDSEESANSSWDGQIRVWNLQPSRSAAENIPPVEKNTALAKRTQEVLDSYYPLRQHGLRLVVVDERVGSMKLVLVESPKITKDGTSIGEASDSDVSGLRVILIEKVLQTAITYAEGCGDVTLASIYVDSDSSPAVKLLAKGFIDESAKAYCILQMSVMQKMAIALANLNELKPGEALPSSRLVDEGFLAEMPKCPAGGTYNVSDKVPLNKTTHYMTCDQAGHKLVLE